MRRVRLHPPLLAGALALLAGCFTEVGNPDDPVAVSTSFSIDYASRPPALRKAAATPESLVISHFYLDIYDAEYYQGTKKHYLKDNDNKDWNDDYGNFVDFTGRDTAAILPKLSAALDRWNLFYYTVNAKRPLAVDPDSLDFVTFAHRTWMKGTLVRTGPDLDFLFAIPEMTRLFLIYRDTTLARLRTDEGYRLETAFRARWFQSAISWDSLRTVKDRHDRPFALLSETSNAKSYGLLKESFRRAFHVDSAQIDGAHPVPGM